MYRVNGTHKLDAVFSNYIVLVCGTNDIHSRRKEKTSDGRIDNGKIWETA